MILLEFKVWNYVGEVEILVGLFSKDRGRGSGREGGRESREREGEREGEREEGSVGGKEREREGRKKENFGFF